MPTSQTRTNFSTHTQIPSNTNPLIITNVTYLNFQEYKLQGRANRVAWKGKKMSQGDVKYEPGKKKWGQRNLFL